MKDFSRYEIAQVIADEFDLLASDLSPIGEIGSFKELDADEQDMMNLCAELEDEFDIRIPPEIEKQWVTFQDVYDYFDSLQQGAETR